MRIIFAGTPEFAAHHLSALIEKKLDVVAVYTQPDRPSGRGKKLKASDVKVLANEHNIPVCQPQNFKPSDAINELDKWQADIMVVVAYGIILPAEVLALPRFGCINVHGSLLPKWRGAAPIQRAIWAGDTQTGVTIMQMDEGLDTGPILTKSVIDIAPSDTSSSMYEKLATIGPIALVDALETYSQLIATPQDEQLVSYAKKLSKDEAKINWQLDAVQLERNCRAFNPWPVQWFSINDTSIKVWACHIEEISIAEPPLCTTVAGEIIRADRSGIVIATGSGYLCLTKLQLPGKKPIAACDILNGRADWFSVGNIL